jgi:hypothetical protein
VATLMEINHFEIKIVKDLVYDKLIDIEREKADTSEVRRTYIEMLRHLEDRLAKELMPSFGVREVRDL